MDCKRNLEDGYASRKLSEICFLDFRQPWWPLRIARKIPELEEVDRNSNRFWNSSILHR